MPTPPPPPKGSSLSFLDTKLRELTICSNSGSSLTIAEDAKIPPKLFGIPFHGKKRLNSSWDDQATSSNRTNSFQRLQPPSKGLKTDLTLNLMPLSEAVATPAALWLKFCSPPVADKKPYNNTILNRVQK
eukprot:Gb_22468 [translate_table: standard]